MALPVSFKRGLFQGDALSPFLFCMSVAPISRSLRSTPGIVSSFQPSKITHLLYMDDLKLYDSSRSRLERAVQVTEKMSGELGMSHRLRKCAVLHMKEGRVVSRGDLRLTSDETLPELNPDETYRYLWLDQLVEAQKSRTWKRLSEQYLTRVEQVWSSGLNSGDKTRAHNMWAVALLRYYLHAGVGTRSSMRALDRKTRGVLKKCRTHEDGGGGSGAPLPEAKGWWEGAH